MSKFSMNNIFEDKTFVTFDDKERAYFFEKNTGKIWLIHRFPNQVKPEGVSRAQEEQNSHPNAWVYIIVPPLATFWWLASESLNSFFSSYASVSVNSLLLFGTLILAAVPAIYLRRRFAKRVYKSYLESACNYLPIALEDNKREGVLKLGRSGMRLATVAFVVLLFVTIGVGYNFIVTSNIAILVIPSPCVFGLIMLTFSPKDRWKSWRITRKMLSDIRHERGRRGG